MNKLLFGLKEDVAYGKSYPIYIRKKGQDVRIGNVSLIDNLPVPPDAKKDIMLEARKAKVVFSMNRRYFRKLTFEMFQEVQNKILTGDKHDGSEVQNENI